MKQMKKFQNPKLLILKLKQLKTPTLKPKESDCIAPCTATSTYTRAPLISGLQSHLTRTLLMMMCCCANESVEEDDDDCGVGGDGG